MLLRVVLLFLIGMAVLAMFGKLRLPKGRRCTRCGKPLLSAKMGCGCKGKRG
jgi:hypothetical protein